MIIWNITVEGGWVGGRKGVVRSSKSLVKVAAIICGEKLQGRRSRDRRKIHPNIHNIAIDSWKS